jgi:hypothetical protein
MAGTIDPGFQGAPVLKDEFNPVELVQNLKNKQFETQKALYEQKGTGNKDYLNKLTTELKGWEDQKGFAELQARNTNAYDTALKLMKKGANLGNPKNDAEITLVKYLNDYHNQTKQLADQWNVQKGLYDQIQSALVKDNELPEGEQRIDHEATQKNLAELLNAHTISDRAGLLQNAIVTRPQRGDVDKFIANIGKNAPKLDVESHPITDAQGNVHNITTEVQDSKKEQQIIKYYRNQYKYADKATKAYVHSQGEQNKDNEPAGWDDTDRFVAMAYPNYKQRFLDKESSKGGNMVINFGGNKMKMSPGQKADDVREYGGKNYQGVYDFNSHPTFTVNVGNPGVMGIFGKKQKVVENGNDVDAKLMSYDPEGDSFIFRAVNPAEATQVFKTQTFIVPRTSLKDDFSKLPIMESGKLTTVEAIAGERPIVKKSGISWN